MSSETTQAECLAIYNTSKPYIKNFQTAIDVGCRDGDFTIPLSKHFASVKAFDYRIKSNLMKRLPTNTQYFETALGDKVDTVKSYGGVILDQRGNRKKSEILVQQKTLDSFNFANVDYIKIDVEGHELKVLKGAYKTIQKYSPLIVVEENGSAEKWNKGKQNEALDYLQSLNYKIVARQINDYILQRSEA